MDMRHKNPAYLVPAGQFFDQPMSIRADGAIAGFDSIAGNQDGDDGDFEVRINAAGFGMEDIKIDYLEHDRDLVVSARKKDVESGSTKEFRRTYSVPESCDPRQLRSSLSDRGLLRITAPRSRSRVEDNNEVALYSKRNHYLTHNMTIAERNSKAEEETVRIFNNYSSGASRISEGEGAFRVEVDVDGFSARDLSVEVVAGGIITVSGEHQEGGPAEGASVSRKFSRQYQIPEGYDPNRVSSKLSAANKLLTVEVSKKVQAQSPKKVRVQVKK